MPERDDDTLEACDIDFAEHAVSDEEVALLPLFPQGLNTPNLEEKAAEWRALLSPGG